jgi:hypothetical protein
LLVLTFERECQSLRILSVCVFFLRKSNKIYIFLKLRHEPFAFHSNLAQALGDTI